MKTDVITVTSGGQGMADALDQAAAVAAYKDLNRKKTLHLRLLTEEMLGLMRSVTGDMDGKFWIEDQRGICEIHLVVDTPMTAKKRAGLLSASTSGKNAAATGIMGRLRDFFTRDDDFDAGFFTPMMSEAVFESGTSPTLDMEWSLARYRAELLAHPREDEEAAKAWDELEKSVVTHVADEVKVYIRGDRVEMVILKNFM